jgi:hypothetical protein
MTRSQPILPLRIYDNLFDQQRFNSHCHNTEQFDLVHPANELPTFQFSRTSSLELPDHFYLRNTCSDPTSNFGYYKQIPESAAIFGDYAANEFYGSFPTGAGAIFDNGIDPPSGVILDEFLNIGCDKLYPEIDEFYTVTSTGAELVVPLTSSVQNYVLKLIVDKIVVSVGSSFAIKVYAGTQAGTLLGTITTPGIYTFSFNTAATQITLAFGDFTYGDDFEISYVQVTTNTFMAPGASDVVLDETKLKVIPMADGTDIIAYCEPNQNYAPAPGYYYYVIVIDTQVYFSEVFKIESLLQIEKYYRLRWRNSCDINSLVLYGTGPLECVFYNTLYLDAALFNPEHDTKQENEQDGDDNLVTVFSTWHKNLNLEIGKAPEFIADALSAVFIHDDVKIKKPINQYQDLNSNEFSIRNVVPNVEPVLADCYLKVTLKLLLNDGYTKTGCCNEADYYDCTPCQYTAGDDCSGDYRLIMSGPPEEGDGLINCATNQLVKVKETDIICYDGKYWSLTLLGGIWQPSKVMPGITDVDVLFGAIVITGYVLPYSFAVVEYNKDGAGWVEVGSALSLSSGAYQVAAPTSLASGATDLKFRVKSKTLTCDFGYSDEFDYI